MVAVVVFNFLARRLPVVILLAPAADIGDQYGNLRIWGITDKPVAISFSMSWQIKACDSIAAQSMAA